MWALARNSSGFVRRRTLLSARAVRPQEFGFRLVADLNASSTAQGFDRPIHVLQRTRATVPRAPRLLPQPPGQDAGPRSAAAPQRNVASEGVGPGGLGAHDADSGPAEEEGAGEQAAEARDGDMDGGGLVEETV